MNKVNPESKKRKVVEILDKAKRYQIKGELDQADKYLKKAITLNPYNPEYYFLLGNNFYSNNKFNEAIKYFLKSIELDKEFLNAYYNIANSFKALKQYKDAEIYLSKLIEINPAYEYANYNLGIVRQYLGDNRNAIVSYQKEIKINPKFADSYSNLSIIFKQENNLKEAERLLKLAIKINPNYAIAYSNLSSIFQETGNLKEAENSALKAIQINPHIASSFANLGNIQSELGEFSKAELSTRKAIELDPNFFNAYLNLANIHRLNSKFSEANLSIQKAIEINPYSAKAYALLGAIQNNLRNPLKALDAYKRSLEIDGNQVEAKLGIQQINNQLVPQWHIPMINDKQRNKAYKDAIISVLKSNENVLEIGTGSGLLSMIASDAGASKVVTCEQSKSIADIAKKIIKKNGYDDNIEVVNKNSTELVIGDDLAEKPDLIISEILSAEFVGEGIFSTIYDAYNRILNKNGRMIPQEGDIRFALIAPNEEVNNQVTAGVVNGYDLSDFNSIIGNKFSLRLNDKPHFLSDIIIAWNFCFCSKKKMRKEEKIISVSVKETGICIGLIQWIGLQLCEGINYENKPGYIKSHWPTPIHIFNKPIEVIKGEIIKIKFTILENNIFFELI